MPCQVLVEAKAVGHNGAISKFELKRVGNLLQVFSGIGKDGSIYCTSRKMSKSNGQEVVAQISDF